MRGGQSISVPPSRQSYLVDSEISSRTTRGGSVATSQTQAARSSGWSMRARASGERRLRTLVEQRRVDVARADRARAHAVAALLGVDLLRQAHQAELRRDVRRAREIPRGFADIGVDVDDRPGLALAASRAGTPARSSRRRGGSWRGPGASRRSTASRSCARGTLMPAAFTSTSTSPKRASTAAPIAATSSGSLTSQGNTPTRPSASEPASAAVSASVSARRPTSATCHPSAANLIATARPTPLPAPVTTAVLIGRAYSFTMLANR